MILIADSGSTKTKWVVVDNKKIIRSFLSKGMNPYLQTPNDAEQTIIHELLPQLNGLTVSDLHFYGAGCTPEKTSIIYNLLSRYFPATKTISVESDMMGAARGLCGCHPGIVCILGTGSNSCFYDGENITENVSPLGYILGDEGSGAVLGRTLVGDLLKNQLPKGLKEEFLQTYSFTPADIIESVYRKPFPNRFLAKFSPFILEHIDVPEIKQLVIRNFTDFIERNVKQYDYKSHSVHFTGSIAYHYKTILEEAATACGITIGSIVKDPIDGLLSNEL